MFSSRARAVSRQIPTHACLIPGVNCTRVVWLARPPLTVEADEFQQAGGDLATRVKRFLQNCPIGACSF